MTRFNAKTLAAVRAIERQAARYDAALYGVRGLFESSEEVTEDEFRVYIETTGLLKNYPGLSGIGYATLDGGTDVLRMSKIFVEPAGNGQPTEIASFLLDDARREAVEDARDSGKGTITRSTQMPFINKKGFFLVVPIYRSGSRPITLEDRRTWFIGAVFARVEADLFFVSVFDWQQVAALNFVIYDIVRADPARIVYSHSGSLSPDNHAYEQHAPFRMVNQTWSARFTAPKGLLTESEREKPLIALIGGVIVSMLLFLISWLQTKNLGHRKIQAAQLEYQARHDSLTGLPNRFRFYDNARVQLANPDARGCIALLDLDGFKEINDTLGHHSGDVLLRAVGPRLNSVVPATGLLARLGGDEFAIMLTWVSREETKRWAKKLLEALQQPFEVGGIKLQISGSLGIACYPDDGKDIGTLMRCADVAMYVAKHDSCRYRFYDRADDRNTPQRLMMMTELRDAIRNDQLVLHYQPKIDLKTNSWVGVEALVRWQHPSRGLIMPNDFIPLAEMTDLISPLTSWVIEESLRQWRTWHDAGLHMRVCVNLSMRNLQDEDLPAKLAELLLRYSVEHNCLEFELTESALLADPERAFAVVTKISEMGILFAIDDFGTGYSSLSYLRRLPVQSLKIDLSFVRAMRDNAEDAAIVRSTIQLAHNLQMEAIAEGVEDKETLEMLRGLGSNLAQGYYIGKPMDPTALAEWAAKSTWKTPSQS